MSDVHIKIEGYADDGSLAHYRDIPLSVDIVDERFEKREMPMEGEATVTLDPGVYVVRAHLPSGQTLSETTKVEAGKPVDITLRPARSPHEWLWWSHFLGDALPPASSPSLADFPATWMRLWQYDPGMPEAWRTLPPSMWTRNTWRDERLIATEVATEYRRVNLLQLGGPRIASRFVVLPPAPEGVIQVVVRPSRAPDTLNGGLTFKAMTMNRKAETFSHYLASGMFDAARVLSDDLLADAESLMRDNAGSPMGAALAGYFLLGVGAHERLHDLPANLDFNFEWMADGAVIHAWWLLAKSERTEADIQLARLRLIEATRRVLPVFSQGLRYLVDGLDLFAEHARADRQVDQALRTIRAYTSAVDWNQRLTTFYGDHPSGPADGERRDHAALRDRNTRSPTDELFGVAAGPASDQLFLT